MHEGLSEAQRSEGPCSREAAAYIFGKIFELNYREALLK